MSLWSTLAKVAGIVGAPFTGGASLIPTIASAAGDAIGAATSASAKNRGTKIDAGLAEEQVNQNRQQELRNSLVQREQDRRAGGNNAFRELQHAQYLQGAGGYTPKNGLKSFGFGPKASTDYEKQMAANYAQEQGQRLEAKDSLTPQVTDPGAYQIDPKLMNSSMWEKLGGIAAPILSGYGDIANQQQQEEENRSLLERIAAMAKGGS